MSKGGPGAATICSDVSAAVAAWRWATTDAPSKAHAAQDLAEWAAALLVGSSGVLGELASNGNPERWAAVLRGTQFQTTGGATS